MNSIPSTSCKPGFICKKSGKPCSQTSRDGNGRALTVILQVGHCQTLGGAIGTYDVHGTHKDELNCNLFLQSLVVFGSPFESHLPLLLFFPIFLYPFPRSVGVFCRLVPGCLHGIVLYSSGKTSLHCSNQQFQNLRGLNNRGVSLAHSSCSL